MYALSIVQYYDEENITESQLSFRVAVGEPEYHAIDDRQTTNPLTLENSLLTNFRNLHANVVQYGQVCNRMWIEVNSPTKPFAGTTS
jgi:hypothetical protein